MNRTYTRFFIKNLTTFLIPMMVPLLILGVLSTVIIQQYVKQDINHNNMNLLKQTRENIELIFTELDSLHMNIVASAVEFVNLRFMLDKDFLDSEESRQLAALKNFIDSPAIARPYIDSIYIYMDNKRQHFISSTTGGLVELKEFYDQAWYNTYIHYPLNELQWTESRTIYKPGIGKVSTPLDVITMYQKVTFADGSHGVIVLNINPEYIEKNLAGLSTLDDQNLFIIDVNHKIVFRNKELDYLGGTNISQVVEEKRTFFQMDINSETYIVNKLVPNKYGWTFISIAPQSSLYKVPIHLSLIALLLVVLSFVAGTVLAFKLTQKKYSDIKTIVQILDAAEKNDPLPPQPSRTKDVYSLIIQGILKNFIEQNYLKVQLSERNYKAQAMEYSALQSQLNPHFLFNTLETINWKAASLTRKPNELNDIVGNLADILRYSLDNQKKLVTLKEEIQYTVNYIEIQKVRYRDKIDVLWEYDERVEKYNVLKLIMQPIIENSIYHGIKDKSGKCTVKIKIRLIDSKWLEITVIDNGIGMKPDRRKAVINKLQSETEPQSSHIGLINTHKRLKLTFGQHYKMIIRSKFGWGTAVQIKLPID